MLAQAAEFKRHKLALISFYFLLFLYVATCFVEILAPYNLKTRNSDFLYAPRRFPHQVINDGAEPFHYVAVTAPPCDFEGDNKVTEVYDPATHHRITG